jgi:hypothetical protein
MSRLQFLARRGGGLARLFIEGKTMLERQCHHREPHLAESFAILVSATEGKGFRRAPTTSTFPARNRGQPNDATALFGSLNEIWFSPSRANSSPMRYPCYLGRRSVSSCRPSLQNRGEPPGGETAPDCKQLGAIAPTAAVYVVVPLARAARWTVLAFVRLLLLLRQLLLVAPSHPRKGVASDE